MPKAPKYYYDYKMIREPSKTVKEKLEEQDIRRKDEIKAYAPYNLPLFQRGHKFYC